LDCIFVSFGVEYRGGMPTAAPFSIPQHFYLPAAPAPHKRPCSDHSPLKQLIS